MSALSTGSATQTEAAAVDLTPLGIAETGTRWRDGYRGDMSRQVFLLLSHDSRSQAPDAEPEAEVSQLDFGPFDA